MVKKENIENQSTATLKKIKKALTLPVSNFLNTTEDKERLKLVNRELKKRNNTRSDLS